MTAGTLWPASRTGTPSDTERDRKERSREARRGAVILPAAAGQGGHANFNIVPARETSDRRQAKGEE